MNRNSIAIIAVCFLLLLTMNYLANKIYPPVPVPIATNAPAGSTNLTTTGTNAAGVPSANSPSPATPASVNYVVQTGIAEELVVITNADARYTFTSRGGGLKEIELVNYPETVGAGSQKSKSTADHATLNDESVPPVLAILGDDSLKGDGVYKLTQTTNGVRAEKTLASGLVVAKEFQLSSNYIVTATVKLKNESSKPLNLPPQAWVAGTSTPMGPQDNNTLAQLVLWHNGVKSASVGLSYFNTNTSIFGVFPRTVHNEYVGSNNVVWVSVQNQYFALALMPEIPAPVVLVHEVDLPAQDDINRPGVVRIPLGLQAVLSYPGLTLAANQETTNRFNLFAGPKEYHTLAKLDARFNNNLGQMMNLGFFGGVSRLLLAVMNWMHSTIGLKYGLIIIIITTVIKFIFWPLTRASTRSMKRMQALQPQMQVIKDKYKDDPQKQQQKIWEFYKKNKVNPLSGCLPMLLQIPVFFGFFTMLRNAIELRGANFLWMVDLSKPDTVFVLPGLNFPVNPMPLIMGASMLWQAQIAPTSPTVDATQQKIMKYMPLMMLLFMYSQPSGLALYWTVSNLLTILQTKLTKTDPATAATPAPAAALTPAQKKKK